MTGLHATLAAGGSRVLTAVVALAGFLIMATLVMLIRNFPIWLRARQAGAPVSQWELIGMRFRKVDPNVIVNAQIRAAKAGIDLSTHQLEGQYLAGGDPQRVVKGLIIAKRNNVDMNFDTACALDLAGVDHRDSSAVARAGIDPGTVECMKAAGQA